MLFPLSTQWVLQRAQTLENKHKTWKNKTKEYVRSSSTAPICGEYMSPARAYYLVEKTNARIMKQDELQNQKPSLPTLRIVKLCYIRAVDYRTNRFIARSHLRVSEKRWFNNSKTISNRKEKKELMFDWARVWWLYISFSCSIALCIYEKLWLKCMSSIVSYRSYLSIECPHKIKVDAVASSWNWNLKIW